MLSRGKIYNYARPFLSQKLRFQPRINFSKRLYSSKSGNVPVNQPELKKDVQKIPKSGSFFKKETGTSPIPLHDGQNFSLNPLFDSSSLYGAAAKSAALQKRLRLIAQSSVIGVGIVGFIIWVYWYSIWSVQQDDLTEEFLDEIERYERAHKSHSS